MRPMAKAPAASTTHADGTATVGQEGDSGGETRHSIFPCFDGFRAIAALSVLVTHVSFISGTNVRGGFGAYFARLDVGVDVFFVISGFLLYRPFVRAYFGESPRPRTGSYFWRRALRIYPAYWLAFTVIVYGFHASTGPPVHELFAYYSLAQIYRVNTLIGPLPQSWSLATEVSFYVFLPIWAALIRLRKGDLRTRLRAELVGIAALFVVSFVFKWWVLASGSGDGNKGMLLTWLPARIDLFAIGMLFAVGSVWTARHDVPRLRWLNHPQLPLASWALAALSFWVVSTRLGLPRAFVKYQPGQWLGQHYLYGAVAAFIILPGVFGRQDQGAIRRLLTTRVIVFLGLVSYGVYLWQDQWIHQYLVWSHRTEGLLAFRSPFGWMLLFVFCTTVATATLSYFLFEKPILRLKSLPARYRRTPAASGPPR
jgi:peptidoglycan/LPS O-acetylase OafA/YrhL